MARSTAQLQKKLKDAFENLTFDAYLYATVGAVLLALVLTVLAFFSFKNLLQLINRAVGETIAKQAKTGGVDFAALDNIALKLGISIPVRNIPSRTSLAVNRAPRIFTFSTVRPQILPGETTPVFLNAFDPEEDPLQVSWNATGGRIDPLGPLGPARWIAPGETGEYVISVTVTDNKANHEPVAAKIAVKVLPKIPSYISSEELPQYTTKLVGLVKEEGDPNIYLVKTEGEKSYKRLLVKTEVINFYPHLSVDLIKTVPPGTLDDYVLTQWIRGRDRYKVYQVNTDGTKQWWNMPWPDFLAEGGSDESVFTVNDNEVNFYPGGPDILP